MKTSHKPLLGLIGLLGITIPCFAAISGTFLPQPEYHQEPKDPAWLSTAVQFHGHLGPWAVAGLRLGAAARERVQAQGYFDVDVVCEGPFSKPPKRCLLDGIQVATGATWGKGNVRMVLSPEVRVSLTNKRTGRHTAVRPSQSLLQVLSAIKPTPGAEPDHEHLERLARSIANMPLSETVVFE